LKLIKFFSTFLFLVTKGFWGIEAYLKKRKDLSELQDNKPQVGVFLEQSPHKNYLKILFLFHPDF